MREISYKQLPDLIKKDSKAIKRAAVRTLNTIGFDAQRDVVTQAEKDMDFRGNARRAMGVNVKKATSNRLEVQLFTKRGWLAYHLEEGTRRADDGWRFNGRSFILVPIEEKAFTKKGRLKASVRRSIYVIPYGRDALLFRRVKRGKLNELIGVLKPKVRFHEDTEPDRIVTATFRKKATRLFKFYLGRER